VGETHLHGEWTCDGTPRETFAIEERGHRIHARGTAHVCATQRAVAAPNGSWNGGDERAACRCQSRAAHVRAVPGKRRSAVIRGEQRSHCSTVASAMPAHLPRSGRCSHVALFGGAVCSSVRGACVRDHG
jgi:hypothetical protein